MRIVGKFGLLLSEKPDTQNSLFPFKEGCVSYAMSQISLSYTKIEQGAELAFVLA